LRPLSLVRFLIAVRLRSRRRLGLLVALDLLDNPLDDLLHLVGVATTTGFWVSMSTVWMTTRSSPR
jgi:hypothetical protein